MVAGVTTAPGMIGCTITNGACVPKPAATTLRRPLPFLRQYDT